MCGICGIINYGNGAHVDADVLKNMNGKLRHRGPDDKGYFLENGVGLAMRRLSIIDLVSGNQPISNEDGSINIVFNGAIYNFCALRKDLEGLGHKFRTNSDTEVIVHLYERFDTECVTRLRGMFAFAIWDRNRSRLFIARDRFGKKPLVYSDKNGRFAFASEIRSLLAMPDMSRDIDFAALDLYLGLQYIPSPRTIFDDIRKLPPAHWLVLEKGNLKIRRYWNLPLDAPRTKLTIQESKEMIKAKLSESVKIRMISDVPLGAFLSGGIDSSVVVGLMSRLSGRPVKTFSIGFQELDFSELPYAREVSKAFGTDHTEMIVKADMADILPEIASNYGEPYADSSALPSYYLAREARRHVTVALNGDGGDENFGGYPRYIGVSRLRMMDYVPAPLRLLGSKALQPVLTAFMSKRFSDKSGRFMRNYFLADNAQRYFQSICIFNAEQKAGLYSESFKGLLNSSYQGSADYIRGFFEAVDVLDPMNQLMFVDFSSYLPECLMVKMDIATMANSLEGRSPFLDHEFVEFVFTLPGRWKLAGLGRKNAKWILKEAMKDLLPPRIYRRDKMGFGIPVGAWFRGRLKEYWCEHVLSSKALSRGYFEEGSLRQIFEEHISGKMNHGYRMWTLLMLELWHREVLECR